MARFVGGSLDGQQRDMPACREYAVFDITQRIIETYRRTHADPYKATGAPRVLVFTLQHTEAMT